MIPDAMPINNNSPLTPIQQFFAGSTILVTGATGFLGKCLLEKLLRCCSDLDKIYIIVREKRGKKAAGRVEELFQDVLFTRLRSMSEKYRSKVIAIPGDIAQPGLGLSLHDRALLQQEVHVVFHVAATVNFNEKLKLAVAINVNGTREVMELCKKMERLKSVVHVSTAYSNCHQPYITEKFYKYCISYKDLPSILEKLDEPAIEELTPRILGDWPNTYTFTKAMAESLIEEMRGSLPVSVFRPGIVVSTYKEPLQGWIDNIYGPTGLCTGVMMGVLGSIKIDDRLNANIIPVDYTTNALIACAWKNGIKGSERVENGTWENKVADNKLGSMYQTPNLRNIKQESSETDPSVFNYVSSVEKPITWGEYIGINFLFANLCPLKNAIWCMRFHPTNIQFIHTMSMFFLHFIPALLIDGFCIILGRKPRFVKLYKQTNKFVNILSYFTQNEFEFTNNNVQNLWKILDPRDKEIFPFSMSEMNWLDFLKTYPLGIRKYLCKDDESTINEATRKSNRFLFVSICLKLIINYLLVHYFIVIFKKLCTI